MRKTLPAWLFLLSLLLGSLAAVIFGWLVKEATANGINAGWAGRAYTLASLPDQIRKTMFEIWADPDAWIRTPRQNVNLENFRPVAMKPGIGLQGIVVRADTGALSRSMGWRIVAGFFTIDGEPRQAALLFSPSLEVIRTWLFDEENIPDQEPASVYRKFIHGFSILKDGSIIFTFDGGVSIQRFDRCGKRIWSTGGIFNHAVSLTDDEKFVWTIFGHSTSENEVVQIATQDGKIVRRISMIDIARANPTIDILEVRQMDDFAINENPQNTSEKWLPEPFHINDVEPLPNSKAKWFDLYEAGDLLVSVRSLNLIFIVDPQTLKVKWWQSGTWRRQHDPDWQPTGELTIYDNRMGRDYSRIVSIDMASRETKVLFDGRTNDFYSRIRGKHQITGAGNLLITSPQQGRVFEIDADGARVFEMINTRPGDHPYNYLFSEAIWYPLEAFDSAKELICER